jgi:hypothetical protein
MTELVSPQCHVKFDKHFETVPHMHNMTKWTQKCHFDEPQPPMPDNSTAVTHELRNQQQMLHLQSTPTGVKEAEFEANPDFNSILNNNPDFNEPATPKYLNKVTKVPEVEHRSRYGCRIKPTIRAIESQALQEAGIVSYTAKHDPSSYAEIDQTADMDHPLLYLFKASNDPDTLTMIEALNSPDAIKFKEAMVLEVNEHNKRNHWTPVLNCNLPKNTIFLPAIWAMRCK